MQHGADIAINRLDVDFPVPGGTLTALRDVSLTIAAGQFVVLIGPSGCGKSTLLRVVGGLLTPGEGHVTLGEQSADQARRARLVSFIFQQPVLLPWYTAQQNVALPLKLSGWSKRQRHEAARHYLRMVGLERFAGAYPHQLSGGMQQRVALARALSFQPAVLLMDEPFGALDEITREHLNIELLRLWSTSKTTVLFVTHSLSEAVFLADRVVVLSAQPGQVVADTWVNLPRPRTVELMAQPDFLHRVADLRQQLHRGYAA